jgi:hypothetical protein
MDRTRIIAQRVADDLGVPEALAALGEKVAPSDLTPMLLDIMRSQAARVTPPQLLERHGSDRFTRTAPIGLPAIRKAEELLLSAVPDQFEQIMLSPLAPFGTHHVLGRIAQNNVVSTVRRAEAAADPTAGLALQAALQRRELLQHDSRSATTVRLATVQRVTRAQTFDDPRSFAHFGLVGLVTAGRDTGSLSFEKAAFTEQLAIAANACLKAGADRAKLALTDFSGSHGEVLEHASKALADLDRVSVEVDSDRTHALGYYPSACFKVHADVGTTSLEYGDGGLVDWGARLLGNAKERMMISGLSVDRVALDMTGF